MKMSNRVLLNALHGMFVAVFAASPAQALEADASPDAAKARYDAACAFIGNEVERLATMVARTAGGDVLVRTDPASGASLFRRQARDLRIDYIITAGGQTMLSQARLGPAHLGGRVSAHTLRDALRLPGKLPPLLQTGCDGHALTVKSQGPRILGMRIDAAID